MNNQILSKTRQSPASVTALAAIAAAVILSNCAMSVRGTGAASSSGASQSTAGLSFTAYPSTGALAGGTKLQLIGTGFEAGATTVTVGGNACTNVVVHSSLSLECTLPAGTGTGSVSVTTSAGTTTNANAYTYAATGNTPGLLVNSFGTSGVADAGGALNYTMTKGIQLRDGTFITVGGRTTPSGSWHIAKMLATGVPDPAFNGGLPLEPYSSGIVNNSANDVIQTADGNIVIVGIFYNGAINVCRIIKIDSTGAFVNAFGASGVVDYIYSALSTSCHAVVERNGTLFAIANGTGTSMILTRHDSTTGAYIGADTGTTGTSQNGAIGVDSSGNIYHMTFNWIIKKYNSAGVFQSTTTHTWTAGNLCFNDGTGAATNCTSSNAYGLFVDSADRILTIGNVAAIGTYNSDVAIVRYTAGMAGLDASFDGDGRWISRVCTGGCVGGIDKATWITGADTGYRMFQDGNYYVIAFNAMDQANGMHAAIRRMNLDGTYDTSFGSTADGIGDIGIHYNPNMANPPGQPMGIFKALSDGAYVTPFYGRVVGGAFHWGAAKFQDD